MYRKNELSGDSMHQLPRSIILAHLDDPVHTDFCDVISQFQTLAGTDKKCTDAL